LFIAFLPNALAEEQQIVITQEDEDHISSLMQQFNDHIRLTIDPWSSNIPFKELRDCDAYTKLLEYDLKILPYLIRQYQAEQESRVLVGHTLLKRRILSLQDL
jgi:hypothetical protein